MEPRDEPQRTQRRGLEQSCCSTHPCRKLLHFGPALGLAVSNDHLSQQGKVPEGHPRGLTGGQSLRLPKAMRKGAGARKAGAQPVQGRHLVPALLSRELGITRQSQREPEQGEGPFL